MTGNQNYLNDEGFDLTDIFIGRDQQLDLFEMYFHRWKGLLARETSADNNTPVAAAPSPDNKIQGLVVLLYGHGGFGKSTLLRHYRDFALKENDAQLAGFVHAGSVIDWENVPESKRSLFTFSSDRALDASVYYRMLCAQLAGAFGKEIDTFKHFQRAMRAVEEAHRQANQIIEATRGDERFASLRGLASEGIVALLHLIPPVGSLLNNQQIAGAVKGFVGAGVSIALDEVTRLHTRMREKLGARLDDYLEPDVKLGQSIGHDLREFARNYPLLLFFDTYEVVDEGDRLLRIVMGAAGPRVCWVIAGRDNLWTGLDQRLRSRGIEYGYKELVLADRAKEFDFNVGGIGTFTPSDLKEYFDEVCRRIPYQPPLARITANEAQAIWDVTKGIPLAVRIAAAIYLKTGKVAGISQSEQGRRDIVDQMVRRYLLHVRDIEQDRDKLYGLAMLRRANQPHAIAAVLDLQPEQAQIDYPGELARLHRRYSFIYTEKEEPALHQEVRYYLRLWLLEHRTQPGIKNINERLRKAHHQALQELEERRAFNTLKDRLQDDEWIGIYLDLAEQLFWLDPVEGVRSLLPFMLAAAIYQRDANKEAVETGTLFAPLIFSPYRAWWLWASQSLANTSSQYSSPEELQGLEELEKLLKQQRPIFTPLLSTYRNEFEAALWWRLGEAYTRKDDHKALEWYEKALARLSEEIELREAAANVYWDIAYLLDEQKKWGECLPLLNRAIELKPDYIYAYNNRGNAYNILKQYEQAINDFTQAITLDPNYSNAYHNRGYTYYELKQYEQARSDFTQAITLDPNDTKAYYNRGLTYLWSNNANRARDDYNRSSQLSPEGIDAPWMDVWAGMDKKRPSIVTTEHLEEIARIDSKHYVSYVCRSVALGLRGKIREGLEEIEHAIPLKPEEWDPYFWKGMLCAYYYQGQSHEREKIAIEMIEKALEAGLPPVLLTPLYWLEHDNPTFFTSYAKPLLEQYGVSNM